MEELMGEWVIIKNDEIVEHNKYVKIILELAEKYDEEEVVISKIPSARYCFY